jgi:hypothetical protein
LWDALEGGNLLGYGALPSPIVAASGKVLSFSKDKLQLQIRSGTITNYLTNKFLEHLFGTVVLVSTYSYIGLSYTNPGDSGIVTTPTEIDYHDILFLDWEVTGISELVNTEAIHFIPTSDWGTLPYMFITDTTGRVLFYSTFTIPVVANIHSPVIIDPYYLTIVFD